MTFFVIELVDAKKIRLDKLLVLNGLVNNVNKAKAIIMAGKVIVNEKKIEKPGTKFTDNIVIRLLKKSHDWVSRGGIKAILCIG